MDIESNPSYVPKIGPEQLEWLAYDLGAAGESPKIVVTHIAALYSGDQLQGSPEALAMNKGMVIHDNVELMKILERHKVKACLQGHCHRVEIFRENGVWYLTSAAVSGAWWSGNWQGDDPGYTLFHCKGDELTWENLSYHWDAVLEPKDTVEKEKQIEWDAKQAEQQRLLELERSGKRS